MQIQEDATNQRKLAEKELMDIQNNLRDELKNTLTPKTRGE